MGRASVSLRVYAAMGRDGGMVEVIAANPNHICVGTVMQSAVQRTSKPSCSAFSYSVSSDDFISVKKLCHLGAVMEHWCRLQVVGFE